MMVLDSKWNSKFIAIVGRQIEEVESDDDDDDDDDDDGCGGYCRGTGGEQTGGRGGSKGRMEHYF